MRIHTMEQHLESGETNPIWSEIRAGKLTASEAKVLLSYTPVKYRVLRPTGTVLSAHESRAQADDALAEAVAKPRAMKGDWSIDETPFTSGAGRETYLSITAAVARGLQRPDFVPPTYWMERGLELEPEARMWFQVETGHRVHQCGFIEEDDAIAGFSPDGFLMHFPNPDLFDQIDLNELMRHDNFDLIDGNGVVIPCEFKVPKPSTHLKWLMAGVLPDDHIDQVHFDMVITGAPHAWFMSYCPGVDPLLIKVERDEYTDKMAVALDYAREDLVKYLEIGS